MAQRGRKSAASLSVVAPLPGQRRPEPPSELTVEEAAEWHAVVDRLPPDWFPAETHGLLVQYCRHIVKARVLADSINAFLAEWLNEPEGLMRYDKLLQMAEREGRAISSLATRMRITQQSRYAHKTAHSKASSSGAPRKPWELAG